MYRKINLNGNVSEARKLYFYQCQYFLDYFREALVAHDVIVGEYSHKRVSTLPPSSVSQMKNKSSKRSFKTEVRRLS